MLAAVVAAGTVLLAPLLNPLRPRPTPGYLWPQPERPTTRRIKRTAKAATKLTTATAECRNQALQQLSGTCVPGKEPSRGLDENGEERGGRGLAPESRPRHGILRGLGRVPVPDHPQLA
jgi:hypothetical protein